MITIMDIKDNKLLFITTRLRATVAYCFASCLAGRWLWLLSTSQSRPKATWLILDGSSLPQWAATTWDVYAFVMMAWILVFVCRHTRGPERVFLAVWVADILISPLVSIAAPPFAFAAEVAKAMRYLVMMGAAALMFRQIQKAGCAMPDVDLPKSA